uniref:Uncharacterized protein n=1 Tax=Avena sativa TaxID=4498 RepID=A0ACD5UF53_AVESA
MENTTSPPHSSCISPAAAPAVAATSAGETSWAMHFADFLASSSSRQEMSHQGGGASESSFSSSFDSLGDDDDDSFITSDLMDEDDDEDDSLQDTACSSAAAPKATSMYDMWMKSIVTMDAKKMDTNQLAKYFLDAGSRQQVTGPVQEVISAANINEKQLQECSDLRKKGLCLVPLSMLIDYLG